MSRWQPFKFYLRDLKIAATA